MKANKLEVIKGYITKRWGGHQMVLGSEKDWLDTIEFYAMKMAETMLLLGIEAPDQEDDEISKWLQLIRKHVLE